MVLILLPFTVYVSASILALFICKIKNIFPQQPKWLDTPRDHFWASHLKTNQGANPLSVPPTTSWRTRVHIKINFWTKNQMSYSTRFGFREISSRENDQWNLDVCKYFSFLGKACQSLGWAKSTLSAIQLYNI